MKPYEKLGSFYLGRRYDPQKGVATQEAILYDAKDLTTHGVCVGMTGSGKTGLCIGIIEEAALDGIPVLAIDPKGDLGNLLLSFPNLRPAEFEPWVDSSEAARKGRTPQEHAKKTAELWRNGLAEWDQGPERIRKLREVADFAIYTPGSSSGLPLNVLRSLSAPSEAVRSDPDALRERVLAAVGGLLALLGLEADPIQSREHILLSNLIETAWRNGESVEIAGLIQQIQAPPFERVGVLDLESFYPSKERFELAMTLNNLLASPGFSAWMEGEPLEIDRLLWTAEGKPRISILSIAHLSESQRMFFVTVLLNELIAWMRSQSGTTSLRALLYMDEVFGYFPPVSNPPSKTPMLTLLKQARAYGLGCLLATQNPVDLDYKGLSNTGTWFLGRLQTERDKERVLDGLEAASAASGKGLAREEAERILSGLDSRVFLMHNVHDDEPVLFHTRWVLSYLRGPLTRAQIKTLMDPVKTAASKAAPTALRPESSKTVSKQAAKLQGAPALASQIQSQYLRPAGVLRAGDKLLYRPALLARARLHFADARSGIDHWTESVRVAPLWKQAGSDVWDASLELTMGPADLDSEPDVRGSHSDLPAEAARVKQYAAWEKRLKEYLYRTQALTIHKCPPLKKTSEPGQSAGEFRRALSEAAREQRDLALEKLRARYATKFDRLRERERKAQQRFEKEKEQYGQQKIQTMISLGATVLGAVLGRKVLSSRNVGRATTAARGVGRSAREKGDIERAEENLEALRKEIEELEAKFEEETSSIRDRFDVDSLDLKERVYRPRKSDLVIADLGLLWLPWKVDPDGIAEPLYLKSPA